MTTGAISGIGMKTTGFLWVFFFFFFLQFCDHCMTKWTFALLRYRYICLFLTIDYIYISILFLLCSNISCILDTVRFSAIKQSLMEPFMMKLYYIYYFSKRRYCNTGFYIAGYCRICHLWNVSISAEIFIKFQIVLRCT